MQGDSRRCGMGAIGTVAACLALLAASAVTGCSDSESPAAPESVPTAELKYGESRAAQRDLGTVIGELVGESGLTSEQARTISALTVSTTVSREPRETWLLASELARILTDGQVLSIERSMETARELHRSRSGARRGDRAEGERQTGTRGHRPRGGDRIGEPGAQAEQRMAERRARWEARRALEHAAMAEVLELTEAQSEALRALAGERPDSAAGPEWRESRRTAMVSILTDEQRQIVTLHRLVVGRRVRTAIAAEGRLRPGARVQDGWGS